MSHRKKSASTPKVDPTITPISTGSAWLPTAPTGGVKGVVTAPPTPAPDPTDPLTITSDMFVDGVTFTLPTGGTSAVPTNLCATEAAAKALQTWLQTNGVSTRLVWGAPQVTNLVAEPTAYSALVPWLEDGKGARENAGVLLTNMQRWGQIFRPVMMQQTVGAFATDDSLEQTDPTNESLVGNVPNEDSATQAIPGSQA